MNIQN